MARHFTKKEILSMIKQAKTAEKSSNRIPYSGMAIVANYVLWKNFGYTQEQLADYNAQIADYYKKYYDGTVTMDSLNKRLLEAAGFSVEYAKHTVNDISVSPKLGPLYDAAIRNMEADNEIYKMSALYFLTHYNVLIDMNYDKNFLELNKDKVNEQLAFLGENKRDSVRRLHKILVEEAGILIEIPNV